MNIALAAAAICLAMTALMCAPMAIGIIRSRLRRRTTAPDAKPTTAPVVAPGRIRRSRCSRAAA
jgi:hypothetical protein